MSIDASKYIASKWLSAADLNGKALKGQIVNVTEESVKGKNGEERKLCLYFARVPKGLLLNRTNVKSMIKLAGGSSNTADWVGKVIVLRAEEVDAFGEKTMAIRIQPLPAAAAPLIPPPPPEPEPDLESLDEQAMAEAVTEEPF